MDRDREYMGKSLRLARLGLGKTSPNPAVGAVIVKDCKVLGEGYHAYAGGPHAEVVAIEDARGKGHDLSGATLYVTLEPCCRQGRTPPCTEAIINSGIAEVVCAMEDPNPQVNGCGIRRLQEAGIKTICKIREGEAKIMNEMYEKYITEKTPFVIVKAALSADGKLSASDGSSKWITSRESRDAVQEMRSRVDAVLVGLGTILHDDPSLTCRIENGGKPARIVLDSELRIPLTAKVLDKEARTIIATTQIAPLSKINKLKQMGIEVLVVSGNREGVDLKDLMVQLGGEEITSVMIEGGGKVIGNAFDCQIVDKVMFFVAPKILGGSGTTISGKGAKDISSAVELENYEMLPVGEDFLLSGYPKKK